MLKHVTLARDTTDARTWERLEVEDLSAFLVSRFERFPDNARIYHEYVAESHDVTPKDEEGIARLAQLPGPFYVVVFPGWQGLAVKLAWTVFLMLVSAVLAPSSKPPPSASQRNQNAPSPNNELSDRSNRARINGRIPDVYGTVRSTPDLIAAPYKVFENNREVEYAYMCIGRGYFDVDDVRDGDTLCENIPGTSVEVYEPATSPNSGDEPQLRIGKAIRTPIWNTRRNNSVNGQVLRPPNPSTFTASGNVRFVAPNKIEMFPNGPDDFTKYFVEGDPLTLTGASMEAGVSVNEQVTCRASIVELRHRWVFGRFPQTYVFDDTAGALLFDLADEVTINALFTPGATLVLTQTAGDPAYPGVNLSGTYTIDSVAINEPTPQELSGGVPQFVIVKLVNPAAVNADWNDAESGGDSWDWLSQAGRFSFTVGLDEAETYDLDLDDTYTILSVTKEQIILDNPVAVNGDWATVATHGLTPYLSPTLSTSTALRWVGPFIVREVETVKLLANFVAANGLYKDDGTTQEAVSVTVRVEVYPVDEDDEPVQAAEYFDLTLKGSSTQKETSAGTLACVLSSFYGRCAVRAARVTETDDEYEGTVVDEVRWRDVYSASPVSQAHFGNVTTVQSVTFATASALAVKERKLTMLAGRRLPVYDSGSGSFDDENLVATENAADILVSLCRDRYIGNRALAELDVPNIYASVAAAVAYFGHANAGKFSYTFDQDSVSFEEAVGLVASAVFCVAYRRGNVIRLSFERQTDNSTLLFNHRNKVPGSEKRTKSFGRANDNDGIEYVYVNPDDDSIISVFLPEEYPAVNPRKVESIGVRNHLQAYFHAWRAWNKLRYQRLAVEFEATAEAELLLRNDRILVADNTRPGTQDGHVEAVDGLELTLSQQVDLTEFDSYVIHLQQVDGSVESIDISEGTASNKVVLDGAPALPLVTDREGTVRTGYVIVGDEETRSTAFMATERETLSKMTSRVQAVNYDDRYYGNDTDFINDLITENGYGPSGGFTPDPNLPWNGGGGGQPEGVITFISGSIGTPIFGSTGSIPSGFNKVSGEGTYVSGVLNGYDEIAIFTVGETGGELLIQMRIPTAELLASPQTAYWNTVTLSGAPNPKTSNSSYPHGVAAFTTTDLGGGFTGISWRIYASDLGAVAWWQFGDYNVEVVAVFT